ncbi:MAG: CPBP family intramembrane glutamic endopeptidase [Candidatus Dormibacteria bacterium]
MLGIATAVPAVLVAIIAVAAITDGLSRAKVIGSLTGPSAKAILPFYNLATTLAFYGALLAVVLFFASRHGGGVWRQLGLRKPPYWVFPLMPVLAVALQFATGLISEALSPLLGGMTNPQGCSISQGFGHDAYLGVIAIVVIAPVVEEIAFRGFIFGGLRGRIGTAWAVVASSLVFALAHTLSVGGSILLLGPSLFIAGVALALVYERTRSLYPGMALHASFNLVAVVVIFLSSTAANCH